VADFSVQAAAEVLIPLADSRDFFGNGTMGKVRGLYTASVGWGGAAEVCYGSMPLVDGGSMRVLGASGQVLYTHSLSAAFALRGQGSLGVFNAVVDTSDAADTSLSLDAGAALLFRGLPRVTLALEAGYSKLASLYDGIQAALSLTYTPRWRPLTVTSPFKKNTLPPSGERGVLLRETRMQDIFPVFFK